MVNERADKTRDGNGALQRLGEVLEAYPGGLRQALTQAAGVRGAGGDPGLARRLAGALLAPKRLAEAMGVLAEEERQLLGLFAGAGGEASVGAAHWWLARRGVADPAPVIDALLARGLLFLVSVSRGVADGQADGPHPDPPDRPTAVAGNLWCPETVHELVAEAPRPLTPHDPPARVEPAGLPDCLRDLFIVGRLIATKGPRPVTTARHFGRADLGELAAALSRPEWAGARRVEEVEELRWLEALALGAGLTAVAGGRISLGPEADGFFERPLAEQSRRLLEAAVEQGRCGELEAAPEVEVVPPSASTPGRSDVPLPGARMRARRRVLEVLRRTAEPGQWHLVAELAERAMEAGPDVLVRRRPLSRPLHGAGEPEYHGLRVARDGRGEPVGMTFGWPAVEGVFVAEFLRTALRRVGVVDIGEGAAGQLFRVTETGAEVLGMKPTATVTASPPARFFLQPNFEIIADGGGDNLAAVSRLSRVADLLSFDRAALLKLSRLSVCRALDTGLPKEEVRAILSDDGRASIPQNVAFSVEEWMGAYERYQVRVEVWVLECDEPEELDRVEQEAPGCLERFGPTAARVLPEGREAVMRALAAHGEPVEIDHAAGLSAAFDLSDRLEVTPRLERWHWYLDYMLARIAERKPGRGGAGRYRLTRESLQGGLDRGLTPDEIEAFVEQCASSPLSAVQRLALRGWLGRYAPVFLAPATILRLPAEAQSDVLALPGVREALVGQLGPSAFAVRREAAARIKRLLEGAGLTVAEDLVVRPVGSEPPAPGGGALSHRWGRRRWTRGEPEAEREALLAAAIDQHQRVFLRYAAALQQEEPAARVVTPQRLERTRWGELRLHAFSHEHGESRPYDVVRIVEVTVVEETDDGQ